MRIAQILAVALVALLGTTTVAGAQTFALPTYSIGWQHDGVQTDTYEVRVDDGAWAPVAVTVEADGERTAPLPAMTPGLHILSVRGCGPLGCTDPSAPVEVTLVVLMTPTSVRVIASAGGGS
jgi:hypothetical protein